MKDKTRKDPLTPREDVLTQLRRKPLTCDDEDESFALLPTEPDCTFFGLIRLLFGHDD